MLSNKKLNSASIYNPNISKWGVITGACLVNDRFQLIFVSEDKKDFTTMDLDTCRDLIKSFGVIPF